MKLNPKMLERLRALQTPTVILSDCVAPTDTNARARLSMLTQGLFGMTPTMHHVNRLDVMSFLIADSLTRCPRPGLVLANIAPRNRAHHYKNGVPFCWAKLPDDHLVVSTAQPEAFAGLKFFETLPNQVHIVDTRNAVQVMTKEGLVGPELEDDIVNSQFRSLDFEPLLAAAILLGINIPTQEFMLLSSKVENPDGTVAFIDNFGNCKLWMHEDAVKKLTENQKVTIRANKQLHEVEFHRQLRNVPNNKSALIVGSSGHHGGNHLCELVKNGGSAATHFKLAVGYKVTLEE